MNVIVTGGTKGIGRAIVDLFFKNGANIAICSRNEDELKSLRETLVGDSTSQKVVIHKCDVSIKEDVIAFGNYVIEEFGKVDILINNAGIFLPGEVCNELEGTLEKMINTNLYSAYHLTRVIVPNMIESGTGHIFNMCSVASKIAYPNGGSYSISKFALLGFSKVLREELKNKNIKVSSVLPGATWSNSWSGVELPKERLMEAEDIAKCIWSASQLGPSAVVEEIIIRPQLGDL